ncbi:MAG: DNA methyltransferase [Geminicoccaceae bacterium]
MTNEPRRDPDLEWLDHVRPTGLVLSPTVVKERGLVPERQTQADNDAFAIWLDPEEANSAIADPWNFFNCFLNWDAQHVAGAPGGPALPESLAIHIAEHETTLKPDLAVAGFDADGPWQLLVKLEPGIDPDRRGSAEGWEATAHQRFERLLRETGVEAGVLLTDNELRLTYAPRGETSGWLSFPLRSLGQVAGRPMLAGLRLLLDGFRLFHEPVENRLQALLKASREAQAAVSTRLAEQVLGALHELLRGLDSAEPERIRRLAKDDPQQLYEGLLAVLMRLVFILYAEDRDLLPSRTDGRSRALYEQNYAVRGLYARLDEDRALNPDTMDERYGGWGQLLALFRLIHGGHRSGFVIARRGKLFDPDTFPFLECRDTIDDPPRIAKLTDGCLLRILEGLMTIEEPATKTRERLSYRTLDVEQIGSVYEIVMGFTVQMAPGRMLAIKAGKNNKTPVFADLDTLAATKPGEREKYLKDVCDRGTLGAGAKRDLKAAGSVDELAAALDGIVDERASPGKRITMAQTPILQPTQERRRTGSHYTPRSLTEPIVRKVLRPTFERLGDNVSPEAILDLKLCDPAMGSGAFLVEACRQLAARLVTAWDRHPGNRPAIPADEDAELLARRLVVQRCLYGVDRNPMAVDLARLSLWLATLARDHEFTFLDHALKCGDSLVGLDRQQIEAVHWQRDANLSITEGIVTQALAEIERERGAIREALDDATEAELRAHLNVAERAIRRPKAIGDAVIAAFFKGTKARERLQHRAELLEPIESRAADWYERVTAFAADCPVRPFHWPLEFPEVFARSNGGFDAFVGNPPFAGKNTINAGNPKGYIDWLQTIHRGAHGNADIVAHFFRRAFHLLRKNGTFGLIATNTIRQGDTRSTGLRPIREAGGTIYDAQRRIKWPGEAAVVVATVHIAKGPLAGPYRLDEREVEQITAFLFHAGGDEDPDHLRANENKSFQGSIVLGMGFTFDDNNIDKGSTPIAEMHRLIENDPRNAERIFPYIGGEEVNVSPTHEYSRFAIDFFDMPMNRDVECKVRWADASEVEKQKMLQIGVVPGDYPGSVAADWPDLLEIVRFKVKPLRDVQKRKALRERWWQYAEKRPGLIAAIASLDRVLVRSLTSSNFSTFTYLKRGFVYDQTLLIFIFEHIAPWSILMSRAHEVWAIFFGATMKDDPRYNLRDCFETFPFPENFETTPALEEAGERYYRFRADLMIARDKGLTKTYNDFHSRDRRDKEIRELRALHHAMDRAVLRAYGWDDLAATAEPVFLDESNEDDFTYQGRLFWPSSFRDEVLARLLALNKERHEEEVRAGLTKPAKAGKRQRNDNQGVLL